MGKWLVMLLLLLLVSLTAAAPAGAARFMDIGTSIGPPNANAAAWGDYDNDGDADLYVGGVWEQHRCSLWRNNGDGTFTDVTEAKGLHTASAYWEDDGAAWGDFNNDGRADLIVSGGNHEVVLYRNDGDHFTDVGGPAAGFANQRVTHKVGRGVAWGDYDGDNWLDVYICYIESTNSHLYHNNGDGTFTDVTNAAGMESAPAGMGIQGSWDDYDGDGLLDLAVTSTSDWGGATPPRLYRSNGDGTFRDMAAEAGLAGFAGGPERNSGLAWGDYDNDGSPDLFMAAPSGRPCWLFHNAGDGTFADVSTAAGVDAWVAPVYGAAWADYDNDGFLDLLGAPFGEVGGPLLWRSDGDGTFAESHASEGMTVSRESVDALWADYDRDGAVDAFVSASTNMSTYSCLYHNSGSAGDGNWLRVRALTSVTGDATDGSPVRDALGARVSVNLDNDPTFPPGRTLLRTIDGGSSFMGQNEQVAQFGLGDATTVAVRVAFPDYSVITRTDVAANQQLEARDTYQSTGSLEGTITAAVGGAAISNAAVTCGHLTTRSSLTGTYRFPFIPAGVYEVDVTAEGYQAQTATAAVAAGETTTVNFALDPLPGAIAGRVTDAITSAGIAGATVNAGSGTTTTGADGAYLLSGLAPGSYTVTATAAGYRQASQSGVVVVAAETTAVDLALIPLSVAVVNGRVREAATTDPIAGAVVTCGSARTLTDPSGAYSFSVIVPGSYVVGAAAAGYWWSDAVTVGVGDGQTVTRDFILTKIAGAGQQFEEIDGGIGMPGCLGAAWGDYDEDGSPDLFLSVNQFAPYGVALLHNDGDLTFTDVTTQVGLPAVVNPYDGIAAGDYDNDGDLDVFVSGEVPMSVQLFRNDGDSFVEVAAEAGITWEGPGRTVSWTDYDADNWLDVIIGNPEGAPPLYHNDADGAFTDVTAVMGIGASSSNWGSVIWADFDNDGWLDAVGSWGYGGPPHFCHNNQGTGFTEVPSAFVPAPSAPSSVAAGDFDNDGWIDVAFGNWPYWEGVQLFRNQGDGTFANVSAAAGIGGEGSWIDAVSWADYDNDGFLDLYASVSGAPVALYHNNGNGTFTDTASDTGLICPNENKAAVWADLDRDGRVDLFQGAQPASQLFHNIGAAGNWLRVRALTDRDGTTADSDLSDDRDAIGARVELNVDNDGSFPPGRTLTRVISGGSGFLGQDEPVAQFGVPVTGPVAVRVTFPDGSVVVRHGLSVNQQVAIEDKVP